MPALEVCAHCGAAVDVSGEVVWFGLALGGVLCEACRPGQTHVAVLSGKDLAAIRVLASPGQAWRELDSSSKGLDPARETVGAVITPSLPCRIRGWPHARDIQHHGAAATGRCGERPEAPRQAERSEPFVALAAALAIARAPAARWPSEGRLRRQPVRESVPEEMADASGGPTRTTTAPAGCRSAPPRASGPARRASTPLRCY
jgi:hypothetical protein